jgi:hypothetical protein
MPLSGFNKGFTNSKVTKHVIKDSHSAGTLVTEPYLTNTYNPNIGFKSKTKAAVDPTSEGGSQPMTPSTKGGASGDGPTPGFTGSGTGIAELNGAQGN